MGLNLKNLTNFGDIDADGNYASGMFKGLSESTAGTIGAGVNAASKLGASLLSNGMNTTAGNILGAAASAASMLPGPLGMIGSTALNVASGLTNAAFGTKWNDAKINEINNNVSALNSFNASGASSSEDLINLAQTMPTIDYFNNSDIGKVGWFKKGALRRKANRLRELQQNAFLRANNAINNLNMNIKENLGLNLLANAAAFGGPLHSYGGDWSTGVTEVDEGGTHELNPLGGVPMGLAEDGQPNLVEEGEVIYNDYVFSNRINVPKAIRQKYRLRGLKEITFADAAKQIQKGAEERPNDPITLRGLEDTMNQLREELEAIRQEELFNNMYSNGGTIRIKPSKKGTFTASAKKYDKGGSLYSTPYTLASHIPTIPDGLLDNIVNILDVNATPKIGATSRVKRKNSLLPPSLHTMSDAMSDAVMSPIWSHMPNLNDALLWEGYFNPYLGEPKSTNNRTEGASIPVISSVIDGYIPMRTILEAPPTAWERSLRVDPKDPTYWAKIRKIYGSNNSGVDTSLPGRNFYNDLWNGELVPRPTSPLPILTPAMTKVVLGMQHDNYNWPDINTPYSSNNNLVISPTIVEPSTTVESSTNPENTDPPEKDRKGKDRKGKDTTKFKFNTSDLRYAPVLGAGIGVLSDLMGWTNKPDYSNANIVANSVNNLSNVRSTPIGDYLTYNPLDRMFYANLLGALAAATRRGILNTSGGNRGLAMAGLLSADYNAQELLGKLYRQAEEYNRDYRQKVAEFNRGTNQFNAESNLKAQIANLRNDELRLNALAKAAQMRDAIDATAAANRSANLTNLFDNLGNIGREAFSMNMVNSNPAYYYSINNGTVTYKNGYNNLSARDKAAVQQAILELLAANGSNAYGGYITIKKGRRK